jgi:subtilisin family serine protease
VCYQTGCHAIDVLAAMVAAVGDGVHVLSLSLSLGDERAQEYLTDLATIGAFFAVQSGVPVIFAAGNSGPGPSTVLNVAPWIFTVGASTMDRDFPAYVNFNGITIEVRTDGTNTIGLHIVYIQPW